MALFRAMQTTFIYVLKDPHTGGVRYVGKSNDPARRLQGHLREAKKEGVKDHKNRWILSLLRAGIRPVMELEDEVPVEYWPQIEAAYIQYFDFMGCLLVNATPGGEGLGTGKDHPLFGRPRHWGEKISASKRGKPISESHRANVSAGLLGKKHSTERCLAKSIRQTGRKLSESHRAAMSAAWKGKPSLHRGRKHTQEARDNMRLASLLREARKRVQACPIQSS